MKQAETEQNRLRRVNAEAYYGMRDGFAIHKGSESWKDIKYPDDGGLKEPVRPLDETLSFWKVLIQKYFKK